MYKSVFKVIFIYLFIYSFGFVCLLYLCFKFVMRVFVKTIYRILICIVYFVINITIELVVCC